MPLLILIAAPCALAVLPIWLLAAAGSKLLRFVLRPDAPA